MAVAACDLLLRQRENGHTCRTASAHGGKYSRERQRAGIPTVSACSRAHSVRCVSVDNGVFFHRLASRGRSGALGGGERACGCLGRSYASHGPVFATDHNTPSIHCVRAYPSTKRYPPITSEFTPRLPNASPALLLCPSRPCSCGALPKRICICILSSCSALLPFADHYAKPALSPPSSRPALLSFARQCGTSHRGLAFASDAAADTAISGSPPSCKPTTVIRSHGRAASFCRTRAWRQCLKSVPPRTTTS